MMNAASSQRSEMLMPVTDDHALRQFELEALRQITDNLKRLNDKAEKHGDVLQGIDSRLIRIESNKLDATVSALVTKVDALEAEKDRREGARGLLNIIMKSPALGWLVGAAITAWAVLTGKVHL